MELQQGPKSYEMMKGEIDKLLDDIEKSNTSKQWTDRLKQKLLSRVKDNLLKDKLKEAWVKQQVKEIEVDALEIEVVDNNGKVVASRHWKCNARNCSFQYYRGNCSRLVIQVATNERDKLNRNGQHACLKHFSVQYQDSDFCHSYFKFYKKLPEGAFLKLKKLKSKVPQQTPSIVTDAISLQIEGEKNTKNLYVVDKI